MCEYIPKDQLLVKFGGEDTWEFDYQVERDRMFELAMSTIMPEAGAEDEDEGEESLISETADRARQVGITFLNIKTEFIFEEKACASLCVDLGSSNSQLKCAFFWFLVTVVSLR